VTNLITYFLASSWLQVGMFPDQGLRWSRHLPGSFLLFFRQK